MSSSRQRIAVYLLAALSVTMLLHVHAALETGSSHCAVCVQQSHGIVEQTIEVPGDQQVRFFETADHAPAPILDLPNHTNPRAPPA